MATETQRLAQRDLTSGSLNQNIWRLAVPMITEMVVFNIAMTLDIYWVGQLGEAALAAVTISMTIRWVMNGFANGLGIGGMAMVARRVGEKNQEAASNATAQTILLGVAIALGLAVVGNLLARPLLVLLGAEPDVLPLAVSYLRVTLSGLFTMVLIFSINSLLRGAGEAQIALRVNVLSTVVTVALGPILIFGWGPVPAQGVIGSAWSFVLGAGAGVIAQFWVLLSGKARISIGLAHLRPDFPLMGRIVRIALPSTIQMTLRSSSRLAIIALVGVYGTTALAAYGVTNRILMFIVIPTFGMGNACAALVGQNLGARKPQRAEKTAWLMSGYSVIYTAVAAAVVVALAPTLIHFFISEPTPDVLALGTEFIYIVVPSLLAMAVGVILARGFNGAGNTVPPMMINLITLWGIEVAAAFILSRWFGMGATGVWWGRSIAGFANGLLFIIWFRRGKWKEQRV